MSTISSPRPSLSIRSPSSSSRTSLDTAASTTPTAGSLRPQSVQPHTRRNRAALRDYYNLKNAAADSSTASPPVDDSSTAKAANSELDLPDFSAESYVASLFSRESLSGVLATEHSLVSEIKGLDGERKALVYDNYSKLIAATDTIRRMRGSMDPLTPATSTLAPAVAHIAETAGTLSESLAAGVAGRRELRVEVEGEGARKGKERDTVRWVLGAPERLTDAVKEGKSKEAEEEWDVVRGLLEKWKGAKGVEKVRRECEKAMNGEDE
ncbi:hypothetical protein K402DRAFT_329972 [Aulographum hederae CBS 113979]|uniref:Vacuolar protein sorting-associated protein 51 homolog n=1 Tax=Aulographum hederae CBS 113979 TaxID=1176131 RepID=A0A6G1H3M0_9PEZI|nr:hypothetical protein K402DRAFT_329972 [Aulographum hederae CBS 113979]